MVLVCAGPPWISLVVVVVFFLSVPHSLSTCLRTYVFPARATALPRVQEFDVGFIYHVRLTLARSLMDGLCLTCRSSDAVQKVFIFHLGVTLNAVVPAASNAESNVCCGWRAATMKPK